MNDNNRRLFRLPKHLFRAVTGADVERYMQGRVTQDVKSLEIGAQAKSLLLNPQGKIQAKFRIIKEQQRHLLVVDPMPEDIFLAEFLKFKVADDVVVENLEADLIFNATDDLILYDVKASEDELGSEQQRHIQRILTKQPEFGIDISEKIIATDIDIAELVSFDKGCYTGQEVVEMSIARGRPNRRFIRLSAGAELKVGSDIYSDREASKRVGWVTSACESEDKFYALGFVKSTVEEDAELFVEGVSCEQG